AKLTLLVQSALGSETVKVVNWDREQLHGGAGAGSAIYRFSGQGRDQGHTVPWSLVLKTLHPQVPAGGPSAWNYYKREADAYQSGWLDDLPGGLAAPRCFDVIEHPDGSCWMWLEDVADEIGSHWPLEHYGLVARHVGQLNGAYLVDIPLPSWPWLSSGWLRQVIQNSASALPLLRDSLDHALIRRWMPGDAAQRYFCLWEERGVYLDALDRLSQTLCHFDIFRRNLFARRTAAGNYQTVAIDWAFSGRGALGEDLVPLVLGSVLFYEVGLDQAQALEEIAFESYLEGLRDAGWQGDPRQVRLGYAAAASLRYKFNDAGRWLALVLNEDLHPMVLQMWGMPIEKVIDHSAQLASIFDRLADEARELIEALE
ncbi:MAG TPA: hypothetical protein VLY63_32955, partial [Anaerolineae bacterium]|nr:hypothetical protein [Anaerolineae bacterium]